MLISFEGGEGAGKSTLIQKVYAYFVGLKKQTILTRAPGGTKTGEMIRNMLLHSEEGRSFSHRTELFLFLADRAQHVEETIRPALREGKIVLCDRFNDSTVAYQGGARGFGIEWVQKLCQFATEDLQPDLTLYLDIDPLEGLKRLKRAQDRIEKEEVAFHQKIRSTYLEIAKKEPKRFHILNGSLSPDDLFKHAVRLLSSCRECAS